MGLNGKDLIFKLATSSLMSLLFPSNFRFLKQLKTLVNGLDRTDDSVQKIWSPLPEQPPSMAIPPFLNFFPNPPLLARLFQYHPNKTLGKHKNKLIGQSYLFNFKKLKNNARCFFYESNARLTFNLKWYQFQVSKGVKMKINILYERLAK